MEVLPLLHPLLAILLDLGVWQLLRGLLLLLL